MRKILPILFIMLSVTVLPGHAQRSVTADTSFSDFRPVGELRVWTYIMKDSVIGRLSSKVSGTRRINGEKTYILEESLSLDYNKVGSPVQIDISGKRYINEKGVYCGDDTKLQINNQPGEIHLKRDGETVSGYVSRGETKQKQELHLNGTPFAIDNDFFDQYELYFALRDLQVGDTIDDSIFVPQTMLMARIKGEVQGFSYQQLHRTLFDSVYVIRLTEPQPLELFFTADKRLLKVNNHNLKLRVYLDVIQNKQAESPRQSLFSFDTFFSHMSKYILLLVVGCIIWFILKGAQRWHVSFLSAPLLGIVLYILIIFIQFPFQEYVFRQIFVPMVNTGGDVFGAALLTVLPAGIMQEGIKLLGIILVLRLLSLLRNQYITIGGLLGLGFGLMEGWYISTIVDAGSIVSWWLWERTAMLVFHTVSGVLLGYAWTYHKIKTIISYFLILVLFDALLKSSPVFIQQGAATAQLMNIVLALVVVLLLLGTLIVIPRSQLNG